ADTVELKEEPSSFAQPAPDVSKVDTFDTNRIPRQRALMSTLLPGLGQAANRKYWKMPIIYGGLGTLGYLIHFNHEQYFIHRLALERPGDDTYDELRATFNPDAIRVNRDAYRRDRDLFIIVSGIVYILNIVDAYVDAHLRSFDLTEDLSMDISPAIFNNYSYFCAGLTVNINFRR
ncbi:MAG: DUF5683 domain-containing protein, partial [Cytophagaceae bacterium]